MSARLKFRQNLKLARHFIQTQDSTNPRGAAFALLENCRHLTGTGKEQEEGIEGLAGPAPEVEQSTEERTPGGACFVAGQLICGNSFVAC